MIDVDQQPQKDGQGIDIGRLVVLFGRKSVVISAIVTALVLVLGTVSYFRQPVRRASVLEFRPTFDAVNLGEYPNGLPFGPSDVAAPQVLDLIFDRNSISEYCPREAFRSGFFVEQHSEQFAFLDAEYTARLSEIRLTQVERQRLLTEYEAKRAALPVQYRLVFVKPRPCATLPQVVVEKSMNEVLTTWASESEEKRGVLKQQVKVLTPAVMDVGLGEDASRLVRADLIRRALGRVASNVGEVGAIPGAELVRLGTNRITFAEIEDKVMDLTRSRLEPLVVSAGQAMGRESSIWVTEAVASAEREQRAAEGTVEAYLTALREFSGSAQVPQSSAASAPVTAQGADVQTLAPQVDRSFFDRIVEMSGPNIAFRRQLTEAMVIASLNAVGARERADYYRRLLQTIRGDNGRVIAPETVDARLDEIVKQAKALITDFNMLYDEFSRVSLRSASGLYQTEKPVSTVVSREFSLRDLMYMVAGTLVVTFFLAFAFFVVRDRFVGTPAP